MTSERVDTYLSRLRRQLQTRRLLNARIVEEAREHLIDAIDAGVERGLSVEAAEQEALARFGDPDRVGAEFRQMYRWDYSLWYVVKVAVSVLASAAAALVVQLLLNVRVVRQSDALRLAPGFSKAVLVSVAVVVGLAAVWEIGRKPFDVRRAAVAMVAYALVCVTGQWLFALAWQAFGPATLLVGIGYLCARFDRRPTRLVLLFAVFAAVLYAGHLGVSPVFGASRALIGSAALLGVWTATIAILSRTDHAFLDVFHAADGS